MNEPLSAREAITRICKQENRNSFFFVVGAGVSVPHIPGAASMIDEWRARVNDQGAARTSTRSPLEEYEYWFKRACLFPKERQRYLKEKISGAPVNKANYALAKVLASNAVSKLVLTTNFDMCLARAMGYLGYESLIYDHPATANSRFQLSPGEVQIVHVHGTYQYYDCANLKADIQGKANAMSELVLSIFKARSPIVVGHSGWGDDVIMTTLRRHLYDENLPAMPAAEGLKKYERRVPDPIIWFCYRPSVVNALPSWLKEHPDVFFVLPESGTPGAESEGTVELREMRNDTAVSQIAEAMLPADQVFQMFTVELQIGESPVERDPITFHIGQLKGLIRGLKDAEVASIAKFTKELLAGREAIEKIENALERLDFLEALKESDEYLKSMNAATIDCELARELVEAIFKSALGSRQTMERLIPAWDNIILVADALRKRGVKDPILEERRAKAWASKGLGYLDKEDYPNAITAFDQVIDLPEGLEAAGVEEVAASSLVNKGIALCRFRQPSAPGPESAKILSLYDTVLSRHGNSTNPELRESLASALVNKGYLLTIIGRVQEGIDLYDRVIRENGDSAEPAVREHLLRAKINKAFQMGQLHEPDKTEEAQRLYREITQSFAPGPTSGMRSKMAVAWNGLGWQSILMAKLAIVNGRSPADWLRQGREAIQRANELNPNSGMILGNEAYIEFLSGNKEKARTILIEAIRVGGEKTREGEIRDTEVYPVPADPEYAELVRGAPAVAAAQSA